MTCPGYTVTAEEIAQSFHEIYEHLAPTFGYQTREASAVAWDQVPEGNRRLMIATVQHVLQQWFPAHLSDGAPEVEVTQSELQLPSRRSGARNVSAPHLQSAFIDEARGAMGAPTLTDVQAMVGQTVRLVFNVDWFPVTGTLTDVVTHPSALPNLILDNYRERTYPLGAIQSIEVTQ